MKKRKEKRRESGIKSIYSRGLVIIIIEPGKRGKIEETRLRLLEFVRISTRAKISPLSNFATTRAVVDDRFSLFASV